MRIAEIFQHDLDREIKEVIKVDESDSADVADEIREYVVTDHIHDAFTEVLDQYQESILTPTARVNAWVSGFFGSGKSSFAKLLGCILANPQLGETTAAELFTGRLPTTQVRALLNTIHQQAPTMAVFVDLSSARNVAREGESVVLPLYRELLSKLGYSRDLRLAELEIDLEAQGRLDEFIEAFEKVGGKPWVDRRDKALALNEASRALHEIDPDTYPAADSYARTRPDPEMGANLFADRAIELLGRRKPGLQRIVFIVDEVGQYVSRDVQRMLDLQGFAEACQKHKGRLWLVATGQETLEDVVGALGDKRVELARVRDRFPLTVDLIPSDIEEVVSKRVLAKTEYGRKAVHQAYESSQNQLRANVTLDSTVWGKEFTGDEFTRVYPLLPYQIQLLIEAVSALRAHGGAGPMVGGANRTLIRLAHQLVRRAMADKDVGELTTLPMAYDLTNEIIPGSWRGEIDQVAHRHGADATHLSVVKAIALTSGVRALKLHAANLAVLLHPSVAAETMRPAAEQAIEDLVSEETIREGEDGYKLQSAEEKDWDKTRRSRELRQGDFNRMLRHQHLPSMLRGLTASASREFTVGVYFDDDKLVDGDVTLRIFEGGDDQLQSATRRSRESAHDNDVFLVFARSEKTWRFAEELFQSEEIIKDAEARTLESAETELLHEERKRRDRIVRQFERSLSDDLLDGTIVFRGTGSELDGRDLRPALAQALARLVEKIYTRLDEFAAPVQRRDATTLLRSDDLSGLPTYLEADGLGVVKLEAEGYRINEEGPVSELVRIVRDQVEYGTEPTGGTLEKALAKPPYGAELDIVMILTAAAVRAGLLKVAQGGQWLTSRSDARLEQVFSTLPKFRSAAFRTKEDLDIAVRTRVAQLLHHDLVGEKPSIATDELATFARTHLEADRQGIATAKATLAGFGLKLPDSVIAAQSTLERMAVEDDETLLQSLDAGRNDLKDGVAAARHLSELIHDDRLEVLRRASHVLTTPAEGLSEAAQAAHQTGCEILNAATYTERFAELRGAVETIDAERRAAWDAAIDELRETIADVRNQIGPLLHLVSEGAREKAERKLADADPGEDAAFETGPPRDTLKLKAAELHGLVDDLREEIAMEPDTVVRRVAVRQLFAEPVRSEEELETLLDRIRTAAEDALAADEHFLLT